MESTLPHQVRQLYEVEELSLRQIAEKLRVSRKVISRIIQGQDMKKSARSFLCQPYERLIREWYQEYPFLKATQAYERLKSYGFTGSYGTVKRYTRPLRQPKPQAFHGTGVFARGRGPNRLDGVARSRQASSTDSCTFWPTPGICFATSIPAIPWSFSWTATRGLPRRSAGYPTAIGMTT